MRNESNVGITDNYRHCLGLATQEHLVFLGCDGLLGPTLVATVHAALRDYPQATIVQPGVRVVDEHGRPAGGLADSVKQRLLQPRTARPRLLAGESAVVGLLHGDWLYWPSLVFRRDAVLAAGFRDDFPLIQDLAVVVDSSWAAVRCSTCRRSASPTGATRARRRAPHCSTGAVSTVSDGTSRWRRRRRGSSAGVGPSGPRGRT